MKYLVVFFVFLNTIVVSDIIKKLILFGFNVLKKRKNVPIVKNKKPFKKPKLQYFNNTVYKASLANVLGLKTHKHTCCYFENKNKKIIRRWQLSNNINKTKKILAYKNAHKIMVFFTNKNLDFSLYSNSNDYFVANLKLVLSKGGKSAVIQSKKYNLITIKNKTYLAKTSAFSNKCINIFIKPLSKFKKTKNSQYKIMVCANIKTTEPILYAVKNRGENRVFYNNNFLSTKFIVKENSHYPIVNAKFASNQKQTLRGVKSIFKINKDQTIVLQTAKFSDSKCANIAILSNEFSLIKTNVVNAANQNFKKNKQGLLSGKYLFKNISSMRKVLVQTMSKNSANISVGAARAENKGLFNYYIKTKNKNINYLINSFLPQKVVQEYQKQKEHNSVSSFIKSKDSASLQNYSYKHIVKWLLLKKDYTTLYFFILRNTLGLFFDNNCIHLYKSNQFYGKIYVYYKGVRFVKYNNMSGFYYVYNNIIFKNVPTLQLKNESVQSGVSA